MKFRLQQAAGLAVVSATQSSDSTEAAKTEAVTQTTTAMKTPQPEAPRSVASPGESRTAGEESRSAPVSSPASSSPPISRLALGLLAAYVLLLAATALSRPRE